MSTSEESSCVRKTPTRTLLLTVCATGVGGTFQYGYNISVVNAATKSVQSFINETWIDRYNVNISPDMLTLFWSIIVSIFTVGGFVGSFVGGTLAIKYGRKGALLINNVFALLGSLFMGLSSPTGVFELLMVGRFLTGVNAGIGLCVQPLYLGEIAPRALRGSMTLGTSVFITGGILTGQVVGLRELLGREGFWPLLLSSGCIAAVLQLISLPWFPESPRYLLIDKEDEMACDKALIQLHGEDKYHGEKADMELERLDALGMKPMKPWEIFSDKSLRWQLITIIFLNTFQQLNGINAIYFYADYVFTAARIPEERMPYVTLGTGACECLTALTCGLLIESLGRRVLIIGGYSLMAVWCMCFTLTLTFQEASPWVPYLSMICIFAFILSFGLGPGGITNLLIAELFTQAGRPAAFSIGASSNWLSFFVVGMAFPFIVQGLKQYCFLVFLAVSVTVAIYIFFVVPETKNKTFLEIHAEFQNKRESESERSKSEGADGTAADLLSSSHV
ncbi:solute carrier family 2, facilitated glucose transporter member 11-like [Engraulis encrasicolus]|uniref:solute carrier family 2, facilitated glucose transporter member 11-like n=1 Tax=Engraulis encrasicolus TaxID=184585 RepID=UPI002FD17E18